jgi:putative ABC transport system substrate-binding protein
MNRAADSSDGQNRLAAFRQSLEQLGWSEAGNVRIDVCWGADDFDRERQCAMDLVTLAPDIIFASGTLSVAALQRVSRSLPIVFANVTDPVGAGFVRMEVIPVDSRRDAGEIESQIRSFAQSPNGGIILSPNATAMPAGYKLIIALAAQLKLPAVYPTNYMVTEGGLTSYSNDQVEGSRRAAAYVDRILKGEKPADLPVQQETKIELAINLRTANALGLKIPQSLIARADEVIE